MLDLDGNHVYGKIMRMQTQSMILLLDVELKELLVTTISIYQSYLSREILNNEDLSDQALSVVG